MSATEDLAVCTVNNLRVALTGGTVDVVDGFDLVIRSGEIVGLVGESGSGKTTAGTALLGYARTGAGISDGTVMIDGHDMAALSASQVRRIRGVTIGYVPQDPSASLNPAIRIGKQLRELLDQHDIGAPKERMDRVREILLEVGLPADDAFLGRYPHQLSGGQVQRVAIAMVFLPRPKVLVLDEPTTGLDVTTQQMVLKTLDDLCERFEVAALYVTHDLAVVAQIADRVAVLYAGQLVEEGVTKDIFSRPNHPYTRALLDAIPHLRRPRYLKGIPGETPSPGNRPTGCRFHDRCPFAIDACISTRPPLVDIGDGHMSRCLRWDELGDWDAASGDSFDTDDSVVREPVLKIVNLDVFYGRSHVVHDISLELGRGEVVALVGESGSGKTTISRCVGGLHGEWTGSITLDGEELAKSSRKRTTAMRQRIQYIFQNPYLSLNPRRTVEQILRRPLELFGIARGAAARQRAGELLERVQLATSLLPLRTNRLSGGERQRLAIARALAAEPDILICDEITSALDVSIQGAVVSLLNRERSDRGISMLFVTHDLALVRSVADRVLVLQEGRLVEAGLVADVLERPQHPYTRELLASTPTL